MALEGDSPCEIGSPAIAASLPDDPDTHAPAKGDCTREAQQVEDVWTCDRPNARFLSLNGPFNKSCSFFFHQNQTYPDGNRERGGGGGVASAGTETDRVTLAASASKVRETACAERETGFWSAAAHMICSDHTF